MKKTKEIGYELTNIMWRNIDEIPNIWNKTDIPTKDKIVNETGELAVKLVSESIAKNEIVLPIFGVTNWRFWDDNRNNRIVGFIIGLITGVAIYACL